VDPGFSELGESLVPASTRHRFWRETRRRELLAAADVLVAAITALVVLRGQFAWGLALVPYWVVLAKLLGLYDRDQRSIRHLTVDEAPALAALSMLGVAGLALLPVLTPVDSVPLGVGVLGCATATVAALFLRGGARALWRRITPPERTVVLGDGDLALMARRRIELFGDMHLLAVIDRKLSLPANGDRSAALLSLIDGLDRLIVASDRPDPDLIGELSVACRRQQVKLSVVSPLRGRAGAAPRLGQLADLPVLEYDTRDVSRSTLFIKRCFDLVFASGALVFLLPLYPLAALAIKLDSPGPLIFSQHRAGRNGVPFRIFKLRTMRADAERSLADVVTLDHLPEPVFKIRDDPRVTRVGRFLRRFSLDELPQLVNVIRGEMSIVGPRPEQVELVDRYQPEHRFRLEVTPGMTGPMQVSGRGELNFSERLAVELDYVENLSMARDLSILLQTIPAVVRGTGAY
jgi:exopolysaccharide biosynthesis polyprenyl glycosylphosphotransferase